MLNDEYAVKQNDLAKLLCLELLRFSGDHPMVYLAKLIQKMHVSEEDRPTDIPEFCKILFI
jgi:hypothetical protein